MNEIIVPAKIEYLDNVMSFVKECLDGYDIDHIEYALELGVEELFTNIVNYAYPEVTGQIVVRGEVEQTPLRCRFSFVDSGIPFDPLERELPDTELPIEERPIGGLGIFLVRKLFDEIFYEYKDNCNVFTVVKNL